jgi:hypothetical protein
VVADAEGEKKPAGGVTPHAADGPGRQQITFLASNNDRVKRHVIIQPVNIFSSHSEALMLEIVTIR